MVIKVVQTIENQFRIRQDFIVKEQESKIDHSHQLVLYVEKEDYSYGPLQTGSFMAWNYLDDFFEKKNKLKQKRLEELTKGTISPLAYYKDLVDIGMGDLAARVGVSQRKLRRHMTPDGFTRLRVSMLEKYAEVFGIPVAQLFQIVLCHDKRIEINNQETGLSQVIISKISTKS